MVEIVGFVRERLKTVWEKNKMLAFSPFPTKFSRSLIFWFNKTLDCVVQGHPFMNTISFSPYTSFRKYVKEMVGVYACYKHLLILQ